MSHSSLRWGTVVDIITIPTNYAYFLYYSFLFVISMQTKPKCDFEHDKMVPNAGQMRVLKQSAHIISLTWCSSCRRKVIIPLNIPFRICYHYKQIYILTVHHMQKYCDDEERAYTKKHKLVRQRPITKKKRHNWVLRPNAKPYGYVKRQREDSGSFIK